MNPQQCSEFCANFKPKSPFPQGLKTSDLDIGMVITGGDQDSGVFYVVLDLSSKITLKVLRVRRGDKPRNTLIDLAHYGCQPYSDGKWHPTRWLRRAK